MVAMSITTATERFYATVQDCIDDGNNAEICARGWNNAKTAFYADVLKNMTQQNCQSKYENCYYDNVELRVGSRSFLDFVKPGYS